MSAQSILGQVGGREMAELGVRTAIGTVGATFPWWAQWWDATVSYATGVNSFVLSVGGLMVLGLTIRKLLLDIRIQKRHIEKDD